VKSRLLHKSRVDLFLSTGSSKVSNILEAGSDMRVTFRASLSMSILIWMADVTKVERLKSASQGLNYCRGFVTSWHALIHRQRQG